MDLCPHGAAQAECALCALDADLPDSPEEAGPPAEPEPEAEAPRPSVLDDAAWDRFVAEAPRECDLPLDEGEDVVAQRLDDDGDLIVVTTAGRKLGISPDGWIAVLTGPGLDVTTPPVPKPRRKPWKEPWRRSR